MKNADDDSIGKQAPADWYQRRLILGRENYDDWLCVGGNASWALLPGSSSTRPQRGCE
jgi:hypothetical protein